MTQQSYFAYWGKARSRDGGTAYHLLPWHQLDVAAVAWHLLSPERDLINNMAKFIAIEPDDLRRLLVASIALHDNGKFAVAFQGLYTPDKRPPDCPLVLPSSNKPYDGKAFRHDMLGWYFAQQALRQRMLTLDGQTREILIVLFDAVLGHHGRPIVKKMPPVQYERYLKRADTLAANEWMRDVWALFEVPLSLTLGLEKEAVTHFKQLSWLIAGVTMLADWLGSDEDFFPYQTQTLPLEAYFAQAKNHAQSALRAHGLWLTNQVMPFIDVQTHFGLEPTPLQGWAQTTAIDDSAQLFILEDITGAGKTEAALTLAHRLMAAGTADGFYFGLPTMATSNVMFARIARYYHQLFGHNGEASVLLAHSASYMHEQFKSILNYSKQDDEHYDLHDEGIRAQCNRWFADSRKKALLADIGVGTIDQALMAALPMTHQPLRLYGLHRKVLIYDELHSADEFMLTLLKSLLSIHRAHGGSAILLTATLSLDRRRQLLEAWSGVYSDNKPLVLNQDFPLASYVKAEAAVVETPVASRVEVSREVKVAFVHSESAVLALIAQSVARGQCVVWVRNTVDDAIGAYRHVLSANIAQPILFHSRFMLADRQRIEQQVMAIFGKEGNANNRAGQVLISTQVFQESLDADADVMISDLCPIDYLIQRAGRLHRHTRDEKGNVYQGKDRRQAPVLTIFAPKWQAQPQADWYQQIFPKANYVYDHTALLWLTQKVLQESGAYRLPEQARHLIESVYSKSAQTMIPSSLLANSQVSQDKERLLRHQAFSQEIKWLQGYCSASHPRWSGDSDEVSITTRFSEVDSVNVVLLKEKDGKFVPWFDGEQFAVALSTLRLPEYLVVADKQRHHKTLHCLEEKQAKTLRQQYKNLSYAALWLVEQDEHYCYDNKIGFMRL